MSSIDKILLVCPTNVSPLFGQEWQLAFFFFFLRPLIGGGLGWTSKYQLIESKRCTYGEEHGAKPPRYKKYNKDKQKIIQRQYIKLNAERKSSPNVRNLLGIELKNTDQSWRETSRMKELLL